MKLLIRTDATNTRMPMVAPVRSAIASWLSIPETEATFERRGFSSSSAQARERLEKIGTVFLSGFNCALRVQHVDTLATDAATTPSEMSGFFFEGAAMAFALLDSITPWHGRRFEDLLRGPGRIHKYMLHVGAGWALARIPVRWNRFLARFDPLLRWLVIDGFGFHEGYFHWSRYVEKNNPPPRSLNSAAFAVFDQGLGRSLWFVCGADINRIRSTISGFSRERRSHLWSGVGLASAYAGGIDHEGFKWLKESCSPYESSVELGVAFAAKAREFAGNQTAHTEIASQVICGMAATMAARLTDETLTQVADCNENERYQLWRAKLKEYFCTKAGRTGRSECSEVGG